MRNGSNFSDIADRIEKLIFSWEVRLLQLSMETRTERFNQQNRSIKQIIGHMIDSACNNHQRIVRLQYNETLEFPDYRPQNDTWIKVQHYQTEDWSLMINLWKYYNLHLCHLFLNVDENCLANSWTDADGVQVSLREMMEGYLVHFELHLYEIEDLIKQK